MTFTPEPGFTGERIVVFTADDGKGGKVDSNNVSLIVSQKQPFVPEGLRPFLLYIVIGLALLILIIVFIEFKKPLLAYFKS